jgi:hypothetical protein
MMIKQLLLTIALAGLCLLAAPSPASAGTNLYNGVNCGKAQGSAVCTDNGGQDTLTGRHGTLEKVTNVLSYIGGAAAIVMILISAIRFTTSGSDISTNARTDADVENARKSLTNSLIGLAVIALARTIILFILGKT